MLETRDLHKSYESGEARVDALRGITLKILPGEIVAITGPSGCGKSTLLHILGALDTPTSGQAYLEGHPLHSLNDDKLTASDASKSASFFNSSTSSPPLRSKKTFFSPSSSPDV